MMRTIEIEVMEAMENDKEKYLHLVDEEEWVGYKRQVGEGLSVNEKKYLMEDGGTEQAEDEVGT